MVIAILLEEVGDVYAEVEASVDPACCGVNVNVVIGAEGDGEAEESGQLERLHGSTEQQPLKPLELQVYHWVPVLQSCAALSSRLRCILRMSKV